MIRQALADELPVRRRLRRRTTFAAGQQRLFAHDGSRDDRAPHPVPILDVDRARRADLRAGAAADAQRRRPREVEVGEPAGRRVGHAQRLDAHLAAGGHAQAAADADVAAQAAAGLVVRHRVGQALLDPDVVALAEHLFDGPFGHHGAGQVRAIVRHDLQRNHLGAAHRLAGGGVHGRPAQPGIDGGRGDLPGADRLHGRPRAVLRVAAGKDARHLGHQGLRVRDDEAAVIFDPAAVEDRQVGALTGGEDHVIGFELQQAGGVELRIEVAVLVAGLLAELEGDLTILTRC